MTPQPFSTRLLREAQAEPSAMQTVATKALELWALLPAARAEAEMRRDDELSAHLTWLAGVLTLPEHT